jgi:hypothetical protein
MSVATDIDRAIAQYVVGRCDDATPLAEAGLESLSVLRIIAEVIHDPEAELDAERLVELRTIADLKAWLRETNGGSR